MKFAGSWSGLTSALQPALCWNTFPIRSAVHPGVAVPKGKLNLPHFFSTNTYPVPSRKPAATDNPKLDRRIHEDKQ